MAVLEPMGDQGVLARLSDDGLAVRWAAAVRALEPPWLVDVVQAYCSVAVFHDPSRIGIRDVIDQLARIMPVDEETSPARLHVIPCCYELGHDFLRIAEYLGLSADELAGLHSGTEYTVRAIGFCPGFPYLGYLPERLSGVPRLESPRLRTEPGSVGITGRQTAIYTEPRPGGWRLIGRVPLVMVDVAAGYFPLRTGGRVRFTPIDEAEFERLRGRRLG
jgi:inhibitor of KinA